MVKVIGSISGGVSICFCSQSSIAHSLCESYDTLLRRVGASDTIDDSNEQRATSNLHSRSHHDSTLPASFEMFTIANSRCCSQEENPLSQRPDTPYAPSIFPPTGISLLRLRFRITRFLQCGETFGFDGLARLLLLGAHGVGLLKRGLQNVAKKSVNN